MFAGAWLSGWLAEISADLRENGSALEVVLHDYALYKSTFTLLYFTVLTLKALRHGSHSVTCNYTNACLYLVSVHQMAPPQTEVAHI